MPIGFKYVNEFVAHQNLIGGKNRRWLSILIELGSSNMNFSVFNTITLFRHLALQAGPEQDGNDLRAIYYVFRDAQFCKRLIEQIQQNLDLILSNWRETNYIETLLTLTIQLSKKLTILVCSQRKRAEAGSSHTERLVRLSHSGETLGH